MPQRRRYADDTHISGRASSGSAGSGLVCARSVRCCPGHRPARGTPAPRPCGSERPAGTGARAPTSADLRRPVASSPTPWKPTRSLMRRLPAPVSFHWTRGCGPPSPFGAAARRLAVARLGSPRGGGWLFDPGQFPQLVDSRSRINGLFLTGSPRFREESRRSDAPSARPNSLRPAGTASARTVRSDYGISGSVTNRSEIEIAGLHLEAA
jgi:hypothetical protein